MATMASWLGQLTGLALDVFHISGHEHQLRDIDT